MTADFNVILNFNSAKPVITGAEFKAGDKGFTINMDVRELDPTGMTPKIAFYRSNGTSVESSSVTNVGNIFSYTLLGNELAVPGIVVADLKFYDGDDQRISSASFIFTAISDTLDGLGGGTESYSDELEQLSAEFQDTLDDYIDAFGNTAPINPRGDYDNTATYEPRDMVYDTNTGTSWVCKQESTGNAPANGSAYWQKLVNSSGSANLGDLADVDTTGAASGDLLGFDGAVWEPVDFPDADDIDYDNTSSGLTATKVRAAIDEVKGLIPTIPTIPEKTSDLSDVASTTPTNGQILKYNGTSQKYEPAAELGAGSNQNILINGWFTVNQRGNASYTAAGYTVDRWRTDSAVTITVSAADGVLIGGSYLKQILEASVSDALLGEKVTLSIKYADGTISTGTATIPSTYGAAYTSVCSTADNNGLLQVDQSTDKFRVIISSSAKYVRAVKLEIGSTSTLHLDTAPDYTTELLKCRRYFYRLTASVAYKIICVGYIETQNQANFTLMFPVPMRIKPSFSYSGTIVIFNGSSAISATLSQNSGLSDTNFSGLTGNISGGSPGTIVFIYPTTSNFTLNFDAEL